MKKTIIAALLALVAMRGWAQDTKIGTLAETMWRNETTGDWDIGFTEKCAIYDCQLWDYSEVRQKGDKFEVTLTKGRNSESHPSLLEDGRVVTELDNVNYGESVKVTIGKQKNGKRQPLNKTCMAILNTIQLPAARNTILAENHKFVNMQKAEVAHSECLRPSSDVEGLTDGEAILRKILEPYKGRIVYMDIWGTWCGPCKANLKESWKVKEQLKDYDIVYLYLANTSPEDSWKNVIKEYNLTGPNCVHYNLPREQQAAVERFLNVDSFPTYKLIDKQGNIHPLYWQHHEDMKSFLETIDKMSK